MLVNNWISEISIDFEVAFCLKLGLMENLCLVYICYDAVLF